MNVVQGGIMQYTVHSPRHLRSTRKIEATNLNELKKKAQEHQPDISEFTVEEERREVEMYHGAGVNLDDI